MSKKRWERHFMGNNVSVKFVKGGYMQSLLQLAASRRSVRVYDRRRIKRQDLRLCVETARYAPSSCNSQPWEFIVIDDPGKREIVAKNIFSGLYKMNAFAREAAAFIIIVSKKIKFPAWAGGKLRGTDFRRIDIGIACCHLVLQAQELGIGTCILGWFNERRLKKMLSLPLSERIEVVIALGYPAHPDLPAKCLKASSEVISFNPDF